MLGGGGDAGAVRAARAWRCAFPYARRHATNARPNPMQLRAALVVLPRAPAAGGGCGADEVRGILERLCIGATRRMPKIHKGARAGGYRNAYRHARAHVDMY